jgi:hypothetical protein
MLEALCRPLQLCSIQKVAIEYESIIQAMVGFHLAIHPGGEVGNWIIIAIAKGPVAVASTLRL